ncbi:MAG: hypothetical protein H6719_28865 [Sandaracinaceae bacterium]|nr:hypothetical protein [Sandaracinaceae bacterium]
MSADLGKKVLEALVRSVDARALGEAVKDLAPAKAAPSSGGGGDETARAVLRKIVLSDILDDAILGSRPGDTSFPLRMFFGALGDELENETAFALANGINFYFRAAMDEEAKLAVGLEVSRLYYRFAEEQPLDAELVRPLSPLLARLMSTELEQVRLESVDAARIFDSALHERAMGSDPSNAKISAPKSFLCRVVSNDRVRVKATVRT